MDAGGWTVLNSWLAEAKRAQNNPLLLELLAVSGRGGMGGALHDAARYETLGVHTAVSL